MPCRLSRLWVVRFKRLLLDWLDMRVALLNVCIRIYLLISR
jgi:hypothetical protein